MNLRKFITLNPQKFINIIIFLKITIKNSLYYLKQSICFVFSIFLGAFKEIQKYINFSKISTKNFVILLKTKYLYCSFVHIFGGIKKKYVEYDYEITFRENGPQMKNIINSQYITRRATLF